MHLNEIKIKNLKPKDKEYKVSDGNCLYLHVTPSGSKLWYSIYRYKGKRRRKSLGKYPVVTLKAAREKNLEVKRLLDKGIDPVEAKRQERVEHELNHENNFEAIAREWHSQMNHTWNKRYAHKILRRLSIYLFTTIGKKPIIDIKPRELLEVIRPIEKAGMHEIAHRVLQTVGQIFRYAVAIGKVDRDITQDLRGALKPAIRKNYARLNEDQLPEFLGKLAVYDTEYNGNPITKWGFQLLILTIVRSSELRGAKWTEIDFNKSQWRIPAERMKMKEQHIVPLSTQSLALFKKIHEVTGASYSGYVFPSFANPRKTVSDGVFLKAIDIMGYKKITTGHGFRATASTILNENGSRPDVIERQLAHAERNQIRAAYNHAEYLPERIQMMQWWADYLESKGMSCE